MPVLLGRQDGADSKTENLTDAVVKEKWVRTYLVLADNVSQDENDILATSGVPQRYESLNGSLCRKRTVSEDSTCSHPATGVPTILYKVVCEFDPTSTTEEDASESSIEARIPEIRWSGENEEREITKDAITGDAIQTKAGEPILITAPFALPILEIKRYESFPFDYNTILDYVNHTNDAEFWGAPKGSALMLPIVVDPENVEGILYNRVTYQIKLRIFKDEDGAKQENGWAARVLHHGFKYVYHLPAIGNAIKTEVFTDRHGNPATINLDEDGMPFEEGATVTEHFLEWNRFPLASFGNLNLGPFN